MLDSKNLNIIFHNRQIGFRLYEKHRILVAQKMKCKISKAKKFISTCRVHGLTGHSPRPYRQWQCLLTERPLWLCRFEFEVAALGFSLFLFMFGEMTYLPWLMIHEWKAFKDMVVVHANQTMNCEPKAAHRKQTAGTPKRKSLVIVSWCNTVEWKWMKMR